MRIRWVPAGVLVGIIMLIGIGQIVNTQTALAGSINENEASVISVANGTFEYQENQYVAAESYISQLNAKLSADDVDLNADEAQAAIADIYNNVATGVQEGYLIPKGELTQGDTNEGDSKKDNTTAEGTDTPEGSSGDGTSGNAGSTSTNPAKGDGNVTLTGSGGKFKIDVEAASEVSMIENRTDASKIYASIEKYSKKGENVVFILLIIMLVIALIICIIKRKGKPAKFVPVFLGIGCIITGMVVMINGILITYVYNSSTVFVNKVSQSGYYTQQYEPLAENVHSVLTAAGFPAETLDDLITEKSVYRYGKLNLEAVFHSDRTKEFMDIEDDVHEELVSYLTSKDYSNIAKLTDDVDSISAQIQEIYTSQLDFPYAQIMAENIEDNQKDLMLEMVIGGIILLIGLIILFVSQRFIHRITRAISLALILTSVTMLGGVAYILTQTKYIIGTMEPDYYDSFFRNYVRWNDKVHMAVGILILLAGIAFAVVTNGVKKQHRRNPMRIYR